MDSTTIILWIIGILGLIGGGIGFWAGLKERRLRNQLWQNGVAGEAVITERKIDRVVQRRGSETRFYVTFRFDGRTPDGQPATYTQRQQVKAATYASLGEGDKVPIRYLPANPEGTALLAGLYADNTAVTSAFTFGGGCLITGIVLLLLPSIMAGSAASQAVARSSATAARAASESPDWAVVRAALEPHFAAWKQVTGLAMYQVSPADVGLGQIPLETIVYGYCQPDVFYVYAPKPFKEGRTPDIRTSDAYSYTSKDVNFCYPPGWGVVKRGDLGDGWFLSLVVVTERTPTAAPQ